MPDRSLAPLFSPTAVALVMPEPDPGGIGEVLVRNLLGGGFQGVVLPVSPSSRAIEGVLAYPSLAALPLVPELCITAAPAEALPGVLEAAAAAGIRAVLAVSAGLPEHGRLDQLRAELGTRARRLGLRLLGPDSLGLQVPALGLDASLAPLRALPGHLALVSQSGAVANVMLDWAEVSGVGFAAVVSTGAMGDVDLADCLDHFSRDGATRAILLYLEEITEARRFLSAARAAARLKPVLVLRAGRHDQDDAAYDAAFRRSGMLRVADLKSLFAAAETIALTRPPAGNRLAIVTNGGGIGAIAADALAAAGGRLAELADGDPVDLGADAGGLRTAAALRAAATDPAADAVLLLHGPSAFADAVETARAVAEVARGLRDKPLLACWLGGQGNGAARRLLAEAGLPQFDTPENAVTAFMHLVRYRRAQEALTQTPPSVPEAFASDPAAARRVIAAALAEGRDTLVPEEMEAVLAAFALCEDPLTPGRPVTLRMREDARFGPVLSLTVSGRPTVATFPPLNPLLAEDALRRLDRSSEAAALLLVKLSQLIVSLGEVAELNATLRGGHLQGVCLRLQPFDGDPAHRLAIRPYPKHLEKPLSLPDGRALLIRPVLPEDEPALHDLFARMTPEEVRLRFFAPRRELGHATAARLTQLDYDREMAFVVASPDPPGLARLFGIVHLSGDAYGERAEFAIMIEGAMTGLGLGPLLMRRILDHARGSGYAEVFGEVLRENRPMRKLCGLFGFTERGADDDPGMLEVSLVL